MPEKVTVFTNETGIEINEEGLEELKSLHSEAESVGADTFRYENHVIYTQYGFHLIDFLTNLLHGGERYEVQDRN